MSSSVRARVRALVLTAVIALQGWLAFPLPPRVSAARLNDPVAREELGRWRDLLVGVGVDVTVPELTDFVVHASDAIGGFRQATIRPIQPLIRLTGTGQGWALFASPDTHPNRLELHARIDGGWRVLYRRLDDEHAFLSPQLGFRRVRGVYDATSGRAFDGLARWAADRVFEAYPDADAARLRLVQTHSARPGARRDRNVRTKRERVVERTP